jgi:hypothetical protein
MYGSMLGMNSLSASGDRDKDNWNEDAGFSFSLNMPPEPYTTPPGWSPPSLQELLAHFYKHHGYYRYAYSGVVLVGIIGWACAQQGRGAESAMTTSGTAAVGTPETAPRIDTGTAMGTATDTVPPSLSIPPR